MGNERRLGDVLIDLGLITPEQLKKALMLQKAYGSSAKLGDIMVRKGWVTRHDLQRAVSYDLHIPMAQDIIAARDKARHGHAEKTQAKAIPKPKTADSFADRPSPEALAKQATGFEYQLTSLRLIRWETLERDPTHEFAKLVNACASAHPPTPEEFITRITALSAWTKKRDLALMSAWFEIKHQQYVRAQQRLDDWLHEADAVQLWLDAGILNGDFSAVVKTAKDLIATMKPKLSWYFSLGYALDELSMYAPALIIYKHYVRQEQHDSPQKRYANYRTNQI